MFLNFEKLSVQIIENEIAQMTDDNGDLEDMINEEKFLPNLHHGSIAATFIVNLYETTLNTILSSKLHCDEMEILKTSHNVKLQLICTMYQIDLGEIKRNNSYSIVQSIIKLRNDITHFKNNDIGMGSYISTDAKIPMGTSKQSLSEMFTKTFISKCYNGVLTLLNLLCEKCGLVIYKDCLVLDCDGRDSLCEFVIEKEIFEKYAEEK